ncbi:MAG: DUF2284 domain-containing protein [Desulfobacterales bacterium]|nr:DUF2284 domain-containing protein [Desulfobacterales bacterium]
MGMPAINLKNIVSLSKHEPEETVFFRSNIGISEEILALLHEKGKQYGLESILPFKVDKMVVAQWVNLKCRYGCSQYNANWSCPPATPDLTEVRTILSEYATALLLVGNQNRNNFYKNNNRNRTDQVKYWKGIVSLERMLFLKGYDKAISLVSGACSLCKKCAYPEACRFPMEKRPTVESFGIDLIGTLKNLGIDTRVAMDLNETFKYYSIILLN